MRPVLVTLAALTSLSTACGPETSRTQPSEPGVGLAPPPDGSGLQLAATARVDPGTEKTLCRTFIVPEGGLNVARFEQSLPTGGHHVLLMRTALDPSEVDTGRVVEGCESEPMRREGILGIVYGAQPGSGAVTYPPGAALHLSGGTVLLLELHAVNTSAEVRDVDARLNLWTTDEATMRAGVLHYYDWAIHVPARSAASAAMRCIAPEPLTVAFGHGHLHERGVGFRVHRVSAGGRELLLETQGWETTTEQFEPSWNLEAGDALEFECQYENPGSADVHQGLRAREDEMCSFIAGYVAASGERLSLADEFCLGPGSGVLGRGSLDCNGIERCLTDAYALDPAADVFFPRAQRCFVQGCASTIPYAELLLCRATHCTTECGVAPQSGGSVSLALDEPACGECTATRCLEAALACARVSCD